MYDDIFYKFIEKFDQCDNKRFSVFKFFDEEEEEEEKDEVFYDDLNFFGIYNFIQYYYLYLWFVICRMRWMQLEVQ